MKKPGFGEFNLGAVAGVVTGSVGGLLALGLPRAVYYGSLAQMFSLPILGVLAFLFGGVLGWFLGGQTGPRFGMRYGRLGAEILGGVLGGVIPTALILVWAWYMVRH
ncbi:MAG TPA: hypothetical protein PKX23_12225 [Verrucomicrobiota bacterium]|nr:hypothetical protein [Verrucomicrobiota bacterium]